jgi:hypothetical protein
MAPIIVKKIYRREKSKMFVDAMKVVFSFGPTEKQRLK